MKSKLLVFIGLILIATILYGAATTEVHTTPPGASLPVHSVFRKVVIADAADGDANDFTETLVPIYGYLDRIVIDSAGTDTSYKVYLKDDHAITLFSKTDCSSATEPYSYILSETDTSSNAFPGIPVGGACTLEVADIDDETATAITVTIYYVGYYQ